MARPSKYDPQTSPQLAKQKCREGYTYAQIAVYLGVCRRTIYAWQRSYPAFAAAMQTSRDYVNALAEDALLKRALGFSYTEVTVEHGPTGTKRRRTRKYIQPDVAALVFWLKNCHPQRWRDKIPEDQPDGPRAGLGLLEEFLAVIKVGANAAE